MRFWANRSGGAIAVERKQYAPSSSRYYTRHVRGLWAGRPKVEAVEYQGRRAARLIKEGAGEGFAFVKGVDFQDGTIEAELAVKVTTPPGVRMPGFVGIAFRARPDASHYELFYLRPGNSQSGDQAMGIIRCSTK